jgi:rhodanese-related sulfurtransferase
MVVLLEQEVVAKEQLHNFKVMKVFIALFLFFTISANGQKSITELLKIHNTKSIPYISIKKLTKESDYVLLDTRELIEFKVSKIENSIHVGYDNFNLDSIAAYIPNKQQKIVVYCSLGIRSEDIGEKLKEKGYTNVYNLFGGIFEWKNKGNIILDSINNPTENVHTFNEEWSKWLKKGIKVYE